MRFIEVITGGQGVAEQDHNETALHEAALFNYDEIIKILLDHGADPNPLVDYTGVEAPLHTAALVGALSMLIEKGASLDLKNVKGQTALDVASDDIIIKILREAGAKE